MRRSEVSALCWADKSPTRPAATGCWSPSAGARRTKEGETKDVPFVKDGIARALRTLQTATTPEPEDRAVSLSPLTELTSRGASTSNVDARRELEDEPDGGALLDRG